VHFIVNDNWLVITCSQLPIRGPASSVIGITDCILMELWLSRHVILRLDRLVQLKVASFKWVRLLTPVLLLGHGCLERAFLFLLLDN
jgi:hypothetical protein